MDNVGYLIILLIGAGITLSLIFAFAAASKRFPK
jgi:hypothetical protein